MHTKNIIIIRVLGGLGNQLFIYAFARYLSLELHRSVYVETRTGFFRDSYNRKYRLKKFNIQLNTCPWYLALYYPLRERFVTIAKFLYDDVTFINWIEFNSNPEIAFDKIQKSKKTYLDGYWQYPIYFTEYENIIKKELSLKNKLNYQNIKMANTMSLCSSVAIHLRRVSYETLLKLDYYLNAIHQIKSQIKDPVFFIFSDDIKWCQQNLKFEESFTFVEINPHDEISELWLMSQCRNFIIANSTFSWWGAWLSSYASKIVIAPKNSPNYCYPNDWLIID
jgi:hypothetical protein